MGFVRKYLSVDGLLSIVKHGLRREKFKTIKNTEYTWEDCVMSGLAVFGFKMPSLLQFEKDKVAEPQLRRPFKQIFSYLQRGKALEKYRYLDGHYIISIDGTGQYSSEKVFCECCCEKHHRNGHKVQQLTCKVYQKARKHVGRLTTLFERVRTLISIGVFNSWHQLYTFIGDPASRPPPGEMGWLIG